MESLIDPRDRILGAWSSSAADNGYTLGDPAYLSFAVDPHWLPTDLSLWHFDGTNWSNCTADDLTCGGGYASFTGTSLGGYAITAVPEPSALALLAVGALVLLGALLRRRRQAGDFDIG